MSLDGYIADADGHFEWAAPDEEVHAFVTNLRLFDVLALAAATVLTRIPGTAGGRVAALVATGLLPGLAGDFSFAGNPTAYLVFLLGSLLVAVLVWPVAITSWKGRIRRTHQA